MEYVLICGNWMRSKKGELFSPGSQTVSSGLLHKFGNCSCKMNFHSVATYRLVLSQMFVTFGVA